MNALRIRKFPFVCFLFSLTEIVARAELKMHFRLPRLPSEVVFEPYLLEDVLYIDHGVFGNVYSVTTAIGSKNKRKFALKHIAAHFGEDEVSALRKVQLTPFVCKFYGERAYTGGTMLLLMEYYPFTLSSFLNVQRQTKSADLWPASKVRVFIAEMVVALERIHSLSITHNDMKSENVFIDQCGHGILGDFGIASDGSGLTRAADWCHLQRLYDAFIFTTPSSALYSDLQVCIRTSNDGNGSVRKLKASPYFGSIDWRSLLRRSYPGPMRPLDEQALQCTATI